MTDDAWSNFIASIDPVALERERMRVISDLDNERPGSRQDHEMRHAHDWLKQQRTEQEIGQSQEIAAREYRIQRADADNAIRQQRTTDPTEYNEQLEASIEAYRARKKAA